MDSLTTRQFHDPPPGIIVVSVSTRIRAAPPSTPGRNDADFLINEPGGGEFPLPLETTTLADISCPVVQKFGATDEQRENSFVATRRGF